MTFEIEIRAGNQTQAFYAQADSEAQAMLQARAYVRRCWPAGLARFATFTFC
jgi:hypothetical protein